MKSNQSFLALQDQLEGSENRIAVERKRYNDALQDYNTFIRQFPNSIWAGIAGFQPNNAYFQASEGAKTAPTVSFQREDMENKLVPASFLLFVDLFRQLVESG